MDMEVYDELASCSDSDDKEDYDAEDALYEPSPVRKKNILKNGQYDEDLFKDGHDGTKVTVEQCKEYLRRHGLLLSGTKAVLVERIKRHMQEQETSVNENDQLPGPNDSSDPVHNNLIEEFTKVDLTSVPVTELLKDVKKLTVEDCKAYLRKHGLRLAGTKQVLFERIKEHLEIRDNQGQTKYPETSFVLDCQGDACVGDVVLFKQKVYDFFNVGGRCAAGPPVGIRTIAGRIIKESYGSAKQQHTFTVEVLWSTGDHPLPPLHPLIIKGRNLYRVKTLRQAWNDETARAKNLQEKHARGAIARNARNVRLEERKHMRPDKERDCEAVKVDNFHVPAIHMMSSSLGLSCSSSAASTNASKQSGMVPPAVPTSNHVEPAVSSVELRFNSTLAGMIIGKKGAHCKEVREISQAELHVEIDPANPALCVVKITGTTEQKEVASRMVSERTRCKFFASKGACRFAESCKFSHTLR